MRQIALGKPQEKEEIFAFLDELKQAFRNFCLENGRFGSGQSPRLYPRCGNRRFPSRLPSRRGISVFLLSNRRDDNTILEEWGICYRIIAVIMALSNNEDVSISPIVPAWAAAREARGPHSCQGWSLSPPGTGPA